MAKPEIDVVVQNVRTVRFSWMSSQEFMAICLLRYLLVAESCCDSASIKISIERSSTSSMAQTSELLLALITIADGCYLELRPNFL